MGTLAGVTNTDRQINFELSLTPFHDNLTCIQYNMLLHLLVNALVAKGIPQGVTLGRGAFASIPSSKERIYKESELQYDT